MLKNILESITTSRIWHQARTIWRVATGSGVSRRNEGLDLFLGGASIGRVSALLLPGIGGPELVRKQAEILDALREYTLEQEKLVLELRDEVAELRAALNQAAKQGKPEAPPAAPESLLGELLGVA